MQATKFEAELEKVDASIKETSERVLATRAAKRKRVYALVKWGLLLYILAGSYLYLAWDDRPLLAAMSTAYVLLLFLLYRAINATYDFRLKRLETKLETMQETQKAKLDELMDRTSFKATQRILDRYASPKAPPAKDERGGAATPSGKQATPGAPGAQGAQGTPMAAAGAPMTPQAQVSGLRPLETVVTPHQRERTALDRVVDFMVKDGPNNRYALICRKCMAHNGLARPETVKTIKYRCPFCFTINSNDPDVDVDALEKELATVATPGPANGEPLGELVETPPPADSGLRQRKTDAAESGEKGDEPAATKTTGGKAKKTE